MTPDEHRSLIISTPTTRQMQHSIHNFEQLGSSSTHISLHFPDNKVNRPLQRNGFTLT